MEKLPPKANLRVKEIAEFLDVSDSLVYDMINERIIPHLQINGQKRIPRAEFEHWYESRKVLAD